MKSTNRLNKTTLRDQAVSDVKEISLLALVITVIMSFVEIPVLVLYYATKYITTWFLAMLGMIGWRLLVWAWFKYAVKK